MSRLDALNELAEKVGAGKASGKFGPLMRLWWDGDTQIDAMRAYNGSLDAAKALHEAVLPSFDARIHLTGDVWIYIPTRNAPPQYQFNENIPRKPARAWLLAILKALIAQEESK